MDSKHRFRTSSTFVVVGLLCLLIIQQPTQDNYVFSRASANENKITQLSMENQSEKQNFILNNFNDNKYETALDKGLVNSAIPQEQEATCVFQVTTDYGYTCNTGEPKDAIQNAIYSLPDERTAPQNIYLSGTFEPVSDITLEDNINFFGSDALLVSNGEWSIFETNDTKEYSEIHAQFYCDNYLITDFVSLYNVTFQGMHFKHSYSGGLYAIFGAGFNGTGWEITDNINIYDCEFEGFINAVCLNPRYSTFKNNYFHDNINSGVFFPYGLDLTFENNVFLSRNDSNIDKGSVGLFLFDVFGFAKVSNNSFIQDQSATGIEFLSCRGNLTVSNNYFAGGEAFLIDAVERPFLSCGIVFYSNVGVDDFAYNDGIYKQNYSLLALH